MMHIVAAPFVTDTALESGKFLLLGVPAQRRPCAEPNRQVLVLSRDTVGGSGGPLDPLIWEAGGSQNTR